MEISAANTIQDKSVISHESPRVAFTVAVGLVLLGTISGAIVAFLVLGVDAVLAQLGDPTARRFSQLVANILLRMSDVLVVWFRAPVDGAIAGTATGIAVAIAYLATLWVDRTQAFLTQHTWIFYTVLALAGAGGAAAGSQGFLVDIRPWATLAGALYGLVAAYAIMQSRSERRSQATVRTVQS